MGMKRGVDFKKTEYYDVDKVKRILNSKISGNLRSDDTISQLYQSKDLQKILDMGHDDGVYGGIELVDKILKIYRNYDYKTEVLAASIRSSRQVRELAEMGVHVATIPFNVLKDMIQHYKTEEGVKSFTADIVPAYEKVFE
jgi:transaldolase